MSVLFFEKFTLNNLKYIIDSVSHLTKKEEYIHLLMDLNFSFG
jgi:hypothetical protein